MLILFTAAMLSSAPAMADITGVYGGRENFKLEIASNGDMRADVCGNDCYYVSHHGQGYLVERVGTDRHFRVRRLEDVSLVLKALLQQEIESPNEVRGLPLFRRGRVVINNRPGLAYAEDADELYPGQTPDIVISDDPSLSALAKVAMWTLDCFQMTSSYGVTWPHSYDRFRSLLNSGAPIFFLNAELKSVSTASIDASRFQLPAPPQTIEEIQKDPPILYDDQGR